MKAFTRHEGSAGKESPARGGGSTYSRVSSGPPLLVLVLYDILGREKGGLEGGRGVKGR